MCWEEAEARMAAGDNPERIWGCLYLRQHEVPELLRWVEGQPLSPWVSPVFVFAAHTGARTSENIRAGNQGLIELSGQLGLVFLL